MSGAKTGTLRHIFDLETGDEWRAPFGVWSSKLGVVPLKVIYNHCITISYHISLLKHGSPPGNKPDLQAAMLKRKTTKLLAVVVVTEY